MTAPSVSTLVSQTGPESGGTVVLIYGADFMNPTVLQVTFGSTMASFTVDSDDLVTAVSPQVSPGAGLVDITVTNPDGSALAGDFAYTTTAPQVLRVDPSNGPGTGGTSVIIDGTGFRGATQVTFGGAPASQFVIISDTEIDATSPAGQGDVQVDVIAGALGSAGTATFTFDP